jgi:hypothetical protein
MQLAGLLSQLDGRRWFMFSLLQRRRVRVHRGREPEVLTWRRSLGLLAAVAIGLLVGLVLRRGTTASARSTSEETASRTSAIRADRARPGSAFATASTQAAAPRSASRQLSADDSNGTDPHHPSYTAALAYEATLRSIPEIYAGEPRDEKWASEREHAILDYTSKDVTDLDPNARTEIDCRTSSCRIRIYSEDPHLVSIMGDYPYACLARYATGELEQGSAGSRYADFYILFGDQNKDPAAFTENRDLTCPKYRDLWLEYTRKPLAE